MASQIKSQQNGAVIIRTGVYTGKLDGRKRIFWTQIHEQSGIEVIRSMTFAKHLWESVHGVIPPGYAVHHIDGDRTNDVIENLALVETLPHLRQHGLENSNNRVGTDGETERLCSACERWKPLTEYYARTRVRKSFGRIVQGAMGECIECSKATASEWQRANRVARNESNNQWRKNNPEALRASKRASHVKHREANNERSRASYIANREARLAYARDYRAANREEILAKKRASAAKKRAERKRKDVPL